MKITELYEGAEPKLPGAFNGVKVMTPQQFVASQGDEEVDEGKIDFAKKLQKNVDKSNMARIKTHKEIGTRVADIGPGGKEYNVKTDKAWDKQKGSLSEMDKSQTPPGRDGSNDSDAGKKEYTAKPTTAKKVASDAEKILNKELNKKQGVAEGIESFSSDELFNKVRIASRKAIKQTGDQSISSITVAVRSVLPSSSVTKKIHSPRSLEALDSALRDEGIDFDELLSFLDKKTQYWGRKGVAEEYELAGVGVAYELGRQAYKQGMTIRDNPYSATREARKNDEWAKGLERGKHDANDARHFRNSVREQGVEEATTLPADQRELSGQEFQDYMTRIKGTDDIDKKTGQVKVDKKGIPKYTTGKTKTDKYKMPYIHRSSAIEYYDEGGKRFKEDAVINALKTRPKKLLKQNEKMKHSNGALEQFFNVGFAALTGVAVDESTGKLIIVNTCPGAGSCKIDCFAMKGGKVQFKAAWLSDGRILTYLLNDPTGFFDTLSSEISKEESLGQKGGYSVTIRWHDAGDFFSPEYLDLALKMATKHPNVKFYAYTKMAGAALAQKPKNFIINWSEGANTSQEKQVKANDPNLNTTKNSRIVPEKLFYDLLKKDAKGNLDKGPDGQWQVDGPEKLQDLKQRLAQAYNISSNSILSYDEYMNKSKVAGMKYNVIVAPGEGDISANDQNVLSTLLLRH